MTKTIGKIKKKRTSVGDTRNLSQESEFSLMGRATEGIKYQDFGKLTKGISLSMAEWAKYLGVSERTLHRYKLGNLKFSMLQSVKILEIIVLFEKGLALFGNMEDFDYWLNHESMALEGMKPKEFIFKPFGFKVIENEITRIAWGVVA